MAWPMRAVVAVAIAVAGCAHDAEPEDLTCYATCPACGADGMCAGAGRYTSAACLRRCSLSSDCPLGQRCVLVDGAGSWWTMAVGEPVCVDDDHPTHCRTAATPGQCTDFTDHCLDASRLLVPWFGQKNRICGFEVTRCANGCQDTSMAGRPWRSGRCR